MSSSTANTISVHCPCGKKLKAPATAVGRKAKCPNCGNVMTVTAPPPPPVGVDENDPLYDLADAAHAAPPAPPAPPPAARQAVCPSCHSPMTAGAILCTSCGYDTRSGQKLSTTLAAASAGTPPASMPLPGRMPFKPKQPVADDGTRAAYIRGTILSGVAALIGAFIWFGVAKATEREIGWIAWGVGVLAGLGMMVGANGNSPTAGMIAAAMSVGGILLGKFMVFTFVVMPMFGQLLDTTLGGISDADKLEVWVTNQQLEKKKLDVETATDGQRAAANAEATKIIAKMDARTKAAETKKAQENFSRLMGEAAEEIPRSRLFFSTMFAPLDVLFFILAIASAFKVATFGGESDD